MVQYWNIGHYNLLTIAIPFLNLYRLKNTDAQKGDLNDQPFILPIVKHIITERSIDELSCFNLFMHHVPTTRGLNKTFDLCKNYKSIIKYAHIHISFI